MVSVDSQNFRSCEIITISGTIEDVKMVMQCIIKNRKAICIKRNISDKSGIVVLEIPKL